MSTSEIATIVIALVSLVVSILTAWLTLFRRGTLRITRPTIIAFAFDGPTPKIFLRFLLFSSADRGNVIESMHVVLVQGNKKITYTFWGYGDAPNGLVRGSGLFISREGMAINHHFVRSKSEAQPPIDAGTAIINIYATVLSQAENQLLQTVQLSISKEESEAINDANAGVIYDWNPESNKYRAEFR